MSIGKKVSKAVTEAFLWPGSRSKVNKILGKVGITAESAIEGLPPQFWEADSGSIAFVLMFLAKMAADNPNIGKEAIWDQFAREISQVCHSDPSKIDKLLWVCVRIGQGAGPQETLRDSFAFLESKEETE